MVAIKLIGPKQSIVTQDTSSKVSLACWQIVRKAGFAPAARINTIDFAASKELALNPHKKTNQMHY